MVELIIITLLFLTVLVGLVLLYNTDKKTETKIEFPIYEDDYSDLEKEIVKIINSYRKSIGKNELKLSNVISLDCEEHVLYCISKGKASHDNVGYRFAEIKDVLKTTRLGEVVAYGYKNAESVVEGFKRSPEHNKILIGDYTHIGISAKHNDKGKMFVTIINAKI